MVGAWFPGLVLNAKACSEEPSVLAPEVLSRENLYFIFDELKQKGWVTGKQLKFNCHVPKTLLFTMYPYIVVISI